MTLSASTGLELTINFEQSGPGLGAGLVTDRAGVLPTVSVTHTGDDQHAPPPPHGGGEDPQVGPDVLPVKGPGDTEWLIPHHGDTAELGKVTLVNDIPAECEWDQLGRN